MDLENSKRNSFRPALGLPWFTIPRPFEKKSLELTKGSGPDRTSRSVRAPSMNSSMAVPGPVMTMV